MTGSPPRTTFTPAHSGVYRAPSSLAALRDTVVAARGAWIEIDLGSVKDKAALLKAFAAAFAFPATFGGNWDALADCLQDLSWRRDRGCVLYLRGAGAYARTAPLEWATTLEIVTISANYWKTRDRSFVVLAADLAELPEFAW